MLTAILIAWAGGIPAGVLLCAVAWICRQDRGPQTRDQRLAVVPLLTTEALLSRRSGAAPHSRRARRSACR